MIFTGSSETAVARHMCRFGNDLRSAVQVLSLDIRSAHHRVRDQHQSSRSSPAVDIPAEAGATLQPNLAAVAIPTEAGASLQPNLAVVAIPAEAGASLQPNLAAPPTTQLSQAAAEGISTPGRASMGPTELPRPEDKEPLQHNLTASTSDAATLDHGGAAAAASVQAAQATYNVILQGVQIWYRIDLDRCVVVETAHHLGPDGNAA